MLYCNRAGYNGGVTRGDPTVLFYNFTETAVHINTI